MTRHTVSEYRQRQAASDPPRTPPRISTAFPVHGDRIAADCTRHRLTATRTARPNYFRRFDAAMRMRSALSLMKPLASA